jgi:DNA-binding NtrC family response regulator
MQRRGAVRSGARPKFKADAPFEPRSAVMKRVAAEVEKLRQADCPVLLLGETGTGKSVLARRIHEIGARKDAPFVDINCAGLARDFVEAELFGHERGAFTGAHAAKIGLLDAANGGSLFLDEIGDVDLQVQPKLLKVLEERRFRRMGDVRERSVDVRLVAATHHDLLAAVSDGRFRADLYYRISTVTITMPALRERTEDIVPLAYHLLASLGAPYVELAAEAKEALVEYRWPGNLRELKNVLERALLLRSEDVLRRADLRFDAPSTGRLRAVTPAEIAAASKATRTLQEVEREHIESALAAEGGRVEAAARRLGIPRSTMYQRIKDHGIKPARRRGEPPGSDPPDRGSGTGTGP